jgi:predicted ATPase/DNA-binding SARP family transcriptional activator
MALAVNVRLLGPMEITGPRGSVPLRGPGQRTLVARLALRPGEAVPRSALLSALWSDDAPPTATKTLHSHLAHLRRELREADLGELITTRDPGYVLHAPAEAVDAVHFEALAASGREALSVGQPDSAARTLRTALSLWCGDAMSDCRQGSWVRQESERLAQIRLGATEDLADAALALGNHLSVVGELNSLVEHHPFRERLWELLMLALYRSGRQGDALSTFQRARTTLVDQLGIEPGHRLRLLESAVLRADPQLDLIAARSTTLGVARPRGNLPADITSFVDRPEVAESARLLSSHRLVTLTGVGGVGKTRLALRAARHLRHEYPDGVWLVELAGLRDSGLVGHTVVDALQILDQTGRPPLAVVTEHLRDAKALLLLDNCEHVLDSCALLTDTLLRAAPGLRVLATSRQPLRVDGEQVLAVVPLAVPRAEQPLVGDGAPRFTSVVLFTQRANAAAPGMFRITEDNQGTVAQLCRRLDGIPLAIELAALRLRTLSPKQLLSRLDDRFRLLTEGGRAALPRQQTMRATVDWSFDLCSPAEQRLWERASVFAGSFDLEAAENVCADREVDRDAVFDVVDGLVDKSVLVREGHGDVARYRLLETLRQYGQARLHEAGHDTALRRRHRDWYLRLAERGEQRWFTELQAETVGRMRSEHSNIRAALEFCLTQPGEAKLGVRLAGTLWFYWIGCGQLSEGRHWLDWALSLAADQTAARRKALWVNGYVASIQGNTREASDLVAECRAASEDSLDEESLAFATYVHGTAELFGDELESGARLLAEAYQRLDTLGLLDSNVVLSRVALAITVAFQGDLDRAAELCEAARSVCAARGEQWARAYALYVLGFVATAKGDLVLADAHTRESLRIKHRFNDLLGIALAVELLALLAALTGQGERCTVLLGGADRIWPAIGMPLFGSANFAASHDQCVALARQAMGDAAFESAFRQGRALTTDEVVAYALDSTL